MTRSDDRPADQAPDERAGGALPEQALPQRAAGQASDGDGPQDAEASPGTLWPTAIGGAEPVPMTLESLRRVAMPGGEVPLMPGELYFGQAPARLTTLLGACVSVTVWHPPTLTGGICHYLFPHRPQSGPRLDCRFGLEALDLLAASLAGTGLAVADCEVKLFGGGGALSATHTPEALCIGDRNIECARNWARQLGATIAAEHSGGTGYRRIAFDLQTGLVDIWCTPSVALAWAGATDKEIR